MTNGRYKSIHHRVVTNKDKSTLSITIFYSPGFEAEIGPAPELIDEGHPCLFRKFIHEDHIKHYMYRKVEGKTAFYEYIGFRNMLLYQELDQEKDGMRLS